MVFRAKVLDNIDPDGFGKLYVNVLEEHGNPMVGVWAQACMPSRSFSLPVVGEYVWVMSRKSDSSDLLWMGYAPTKCVENYGREISEKKGKAGTFKEGINKASKNVTVMEDKEREYISTPDRYTPLQTPVDNKNLFIWVLMALAHLELWG